GKESPKADDYPFFLALSEKGRKGGKGGKDNYGDYIYVKNIHGQHKLDRNGHLIVDHDLHNHYSELSDGIAEAFINWAKSEKLSFWK
ncbi:MAG: SAM-dependent methyltransferase, partial [Gammaproteobacteria bacterium]|nr:SAM-dependent methyltransferase [Gammaproteobacteria bacterium]